MEINLTQKKQWPWKMCKAFTEYVEGLKDSSSSEVSVISFKHDGGAPESSTSGSESSGMKQKVSVGGFVLELGIGTSGDSSSSTMGESTGLEGSEKSEADGGVMGEDNQPVSESSVKFPGGSVDKEGETPFGHPDESYLSGSSAHNTESSGETGEGRYPEESGNSQVGGSGIGEENQPVSDSSVKFPNGSVGEEGGTLFGTPDPSLGNLSDQSGFPGSLGNTPDQFGKGGHPFSINPSSFPPPQHGIPGKLGPMMSPNESQSYPGSSNHPPMTSSGIGFIPSFDQKNPSPQPEFFSWGKGV